MDETTPMQNVIWELHTVDDGEMILLRTYLHEHEAREAAAALDERFNVPTRVVRVELDPPKPSKEEMLNFLGSVEGRDIYSGEGRVTEFAATAVPVGDIPIEQEFVESAPEAEGAPAGDVEWLDNPETVERPAPREYFVTYALSTQRPDAYHRNSMASFLAPEEDDYSVVFTLAERLSIVEPWTGESIEAMFGKTLGDEE